MCAKRRAVDDGDVLRARQERKRVVDSRVAAADDDDAPAFEVLERARVILNSLAFERFGCRSGEFARPERADAGRYDDRFREVLSLVGRDLENAVFLPADVRD